MATIGNSYPGLIDLYKVESGGKTTAEMTVVELLRRNNPVMQDAMIRQCNMGTIERYMVRTGLPPAVWGQLYKGVPAGKGVYTQVDETTGFLQARSAIDENLLKLSSDPAKQRLVDSQAQIEALNQEMETGFFYHDTKVTPEKIRGISARYSVGALNPNAVVPSSANQVINGGGSANSNTSIWFVTWADHATSLLYPSGTQAGIEYKDLGAVTVTDGTGQYEAVTAKYTWHMGVAVKDWRYNARIANIDITALKAGNVDIWSLMSKAYYRLQAIYPIGNPGGKTVIYCNRDVLEALDNQSTNRGLTAARANTVSLSSAEVEGQMVNTYRGLPIRCTDSLMNNEANVTFS